MATAVHAAPPLVGFRLHTGTAGQRGQELLDLQQREVQRTQTLQQLRELAATCQRTVEAVPTQIDQRLDQIAGIAVELGLALAQEIVGSALQQGLVDPLPTVVRCLRDAIHGSDGADLTIRLHPEDLASVQRRAANLPEVKEEVAAARFVADPKVPRGGVLAETGAGRLRYEPLEVLQRICAEVRREASA
jgi:flagellar biosynthesis/type III secretory pathway protein FliH